MVSVGRRVRSKCLQMADVTSLRHQKHPVTRDLARNPSRRLKRSRVIRNLSHSRSLAPNAQKYGHDLPPSNESTTWRKSGEGRNLGRTLTLRTSFSAH